LNETGAPVEMLDTKDAVMALSFELRGSRFAMIPTSENPTVSKVNVSFYDMMKVAFRSRVPKGAAAKQEGTIAELNKIETLVGRQCNLLSLESGSTILMASLRYRPGTLEFYDLETKTMAVKEHYRANWHSGTLSNRMTVNPQTH
jgi:translation initiation factor 3 subunit B